MNSTTRSQIVITGPRSSVSGLVVALESEELGRTPGMPPFPIDTVIAPKQRTWLTPSGTARQVEAEFPRVTGPMLATTETGFLEVRYTVEADGSSARAVEALASRVPELTVVLAEQREALRTELIVYRGGRRIAAVDCACNGIVVLPSRHHLTLQECIVQASEGALVTGSLLPFAVLDDVRGNGTFVTTPALDRNSHRLHRWHDTHTGAARPSGVDRTDGPCQRARTRRSPPASGSRGIPDRYPASGLR